MVQVGLLPVCLLFGVLLRRSGRMTTDTPAILNGFIIHVSLPAVTLLHVHGLVLDPSLVYPVSMAWVLFTAGLAFFVLLGRWAGWSPQTIGALILTAALANTSFLGLGGRVAQVTVFEAAMGPQIGGSIVALKHGLDRPLVILMVGIGIPLSFATAPLWWWLLQGV